MARMSMVTRTITTTEALVVYANISENKIVERTVILPRTYKGEREIMRAINATHTDENEKPIAVKSYTTTETLYGMTEADFIANAKPLPPRNIK